MSTTLFDQPACSGKTTELVNWQYTYDSTNNQQKLDRSLGDLFKSVIIEPLSELKMIDVEGKSYKLINYEENPSCEELPEQLGLILTYEKIPSL